MNAVLVLYIIRKYYLSVHHVYPVFLEVTDHVSQVVEPRDSLLLLCSGVSTRRLCLATMSSAAVGEIYKNYGILADAKERAGEVKNRSGTLKFSKSTCLLIPLLAVYASVRRHTCSCKRLQRREAFSGAIHSEIFQLLPRFVGSVYGCSV